ncbi:MAG TPA: deoxyribonuclease IV [Ignavibacteria bacterium]|jgi:deoxyribonuclease-4
MKTLLLGAHCSTEGGLHTAFDRAEKIQATAIQIFTQNARQWHASTIEPYQVEIYKLRKLKSKVKIIISHDSYLINLCAKDNNVHKKSEIAFKNEIIRCNLLDIRLLVFHPGSHLGQGEEYGLKKIADTLNKLHQETKNCNVISVVETTSGQGTNLGYKFEHINQIIEMIENKSRIGVCIDSCHIFSAGYDIRDEKKYSMTIKLFDEIIGLKYLKVIHLNDSKSDFGSRVDRHEHIGKGKIGVKPFSYFMNDKRFINIPKIIETPKGKDLKEDIVNLKLLSKLIK